MQAKEAYVALQARLHAMQAELDAVRTKSSATTKVPDFSYRRIPAFYFSEVYSQFQFCMRARYLCWFTCDMQGRVLERLANHAGAGGAGFSYRRRLLDKGAPGRSLARLLLPRRKGSPLQHRQHCICALP